MRFFYLSFFFVFLFALPKGNAQRSSRNSIPPKKQNLTKPIITKPAKPKPISNDLNIGFALCSDGWKINTQRLYLNPETKINKGYYIEIGEKKDPHEYKAQSRLPNPNHADASAAPLNFIYGKINNFYQFNTGFSFRKQITSKLDPQNIRILYNGNIGFSLGLLKPYYLKIRKDSSLVAYDEKYSTANATYFLDYNYIFGSSGVLKGFNNISIQPGLQFKNGIQFEYAKQKRSALIAELGIDVSAYTQQIPILVNGKSQQIFVSLYANIMYGRKW